jgi:uncharacterized SAM-binding protein YcdF (DUF218 family)
MGVIPRLFKWGLRLGIAVLAVTVAAVLYFSDANLRRYGLGHGLAEPVDAVLVLGGGVDPDAVPAYSSRRRVAAAVWLLDQGLTRKLIFLGGPLELPPELSGGSLMRAHAIALGAPAEALLAETRSRSTFENLRFGFAIAERQGFDRLALLTDAFHLERARYLAAYFGRPGIGLVAADGLQYDDPAARVWSILREALAWWYNLGKVAAWEAMDHAGFGVESREELIR